MKKIILVCLLPMLFIFADYTFAWFVDEYDLEFLEEDKEDVKKEDQINTGYTNPDYTDTDKLQSPVVNNSLGGKRTTLIKTVNGMEFTWIPAGSFMMGSPAGEPERENGEKQHRVTLTKGFYMQTTEVTQGQWKAVMGNNPSYFQDCGNNCPVEKVSWDDVQEFIRKLNNQDRPNRYSLPTEAQWEYAARAGKQTPFYFGKCLSTSQVNYNGNYPMSSCSTGKYQKQTLPVKSFSPNKWGLYNMHGNVWEWCQDWKGDYSFNSVVNPKGPLSGSDRVIRGGSWSDHAGYCRSAFRGWHGPAYQFSGLGFRLVLL